MLLLPTLNPLPATLNTAAAIPPVTVNVALPSDVFPRAKFTVPAGRAVPLAAFTITVMVKAASGTALPAGTVNFALGNTSLGSATLTVTGGMAAAVLSVAGSGLSVGSNSIAASY